MKTPLEFFGCLLWVSLLAGCSRPDIPPNVSKDVKEAVQLLSKSTERDTATIRQAFNFIKKHPETESLKALVSWLDSSTATQHRSAVYALQMLTWDNPSPAFPKLRELLSHSEATTRGMAAMALASLADKGSYEAVLKMLTGDTDGYARRCAAWALGELGDAKALDPLQKAGHDRDPLVKQNAQNAIERLTFLAEHKDVSSDAESVIRGIWLISGSTLQQADRLDRAMRMIRACPEPQRPELLKQLASSKMISIRNSATLALSRLKDADNWQSGAAGAPTSP